MEALQSRGGGTDLVVGVAVAVGLGPVAVVDGGVGVDAGGEGGTVHTSMEPPQAAVDGHVDLDIDRGGTDADRVGVRGTAAGGVGDGHAGGERRALDAGVGVPCLDLVEVGRRPGLRDRAIAEVPGVGHGGRLAPAGSLENGLAAAEGVVWDLDAALDLPRHAGHHRRCDDIDAAGVDTGVTGVVGHGEGQQIGPGRLVDVVEPRVAGALALTIAEVPVVPADAEVVARRASVQAGREHLVGEIGTAVVGHGRGAGLDRDHRGGGVELPGVIGDGHVRAIGAWGGVDDLHRGVRVPQRGRQPQQAGRAAEVRADRDAAVDR